MLTFRQIDDIPDAVLEILSSTEQSIINDMVARIAKLSQVTDSTLYQMERLQAISASYSFVMRELAKALDITETELAKLFDEAATRTLAFDDKIYQSAGFSPIPLSQNSVMQQIIQAGLTQTMGEFRNLTRTTARTATQQFEHALDLTQMQIVSGAMDYKSAIKMGIRALTEKGIASITYPTGHVDYLDVAFRRAAMTGANQMAGHIQEQRLDEMGCNVVETSAHAGARPTHAEWQGLRFFWGEKGGKNLWEYPDFIQTTGYGSGAGLCGWNCRHSWYPVPDPDSPPANNVEYLDYLNSRTVTYDDKKMSLYDATQRQREIERQIRRWKREGSAMEVAGLDPAHANKKMREWQAAQRDFIDQTGLRRDYFRERSGFQNLESLPQNVIINRELRAIGVRGVIEIPPHEIDIDSLGFDDSHINDERRHNVTEVESKQFIHESLMSSTVWDGKYINYYSVNGVTYVDLAGHFVRSSFKPDEFKGHVKKLLEVLKKYGIDGT